MQSSEPQVSPVRRIVLLALVSSVTLVATMFLKLQTPTGYIHLGDGVIYGAALAFGPTFAAISGAIGSSMADVLGGYVMWAPWTFVIKGVAGYIIGKLGSLQNQEKPGTEIPSGSRSKAGPRMGVRQVLAMVVGAIWTVAAYALATSILYSPAAALGESLGNLVQTGSGILIGFFLAPVLRSSVKNIH